MSTRIMVSLKLRLRKFMVKMVVVNTMILFNFTTVQIAMVVLLSLTVNLILVILQSIEFTITQYSAW